MAPASALPIGAKRIVSEMQPISVDASIPGSGLLNRVLAIMAPFNPDESERYDEEISQSRALWLCKSIFILFLDLLIDFSS